MHILIESPRLDLMVDETRPFRKWTRDDLRWRTKNLWTPISQPFKAWPSLEITWVHQSEKTFQSYPQVVFVSWILEFNQQSWPKRHLIHVQPLAGRILMGLLTQKFIQFYGSPLFFQGSSKHQSWMQLEKKGKKKTCWINASPYRIMFGSPWRVALQNELK